MRQQSAILLFGVLAAILTGSWVPAQAPPEVELEVIQKPDKRKTAEPAVATRIDDLYEIPDDFWTHATYDDILLKNDFAGITLGKIADEGNVSNARRGSILDLFPDTSSPEGFQLFHPVTRGTNYTVEPQDVLSGMDPESGAASVRILGMDRSLEDVTVDTEYQMDKTWPGALAVTTVTNDSDEEVTVPVLADFVAWGAMRQFVSGSGWIRPGMSGKSMDTEFVIGRFKDTYAMIMQPEGLFEFQFSKPASLLIYDKEVKLAPGESRQYRRWILTTSKDPAELYGFAVQQRGKANYGYLAGRIVEKVEMPDGRVMESGMVPNAEVRIKVVKRADLPKDYLVRPYLMTRSDENGNFQVSLPPGEYSVDAHTPGRNYKPSNLAIRVKGNETVSALDIPVSSASSLVFELTDEQTGELLPGKISLLPLRGTDEPYLGPPGSLISGNSVYTLTGKGIVEVPEGNYRVVASHGPEYHTTEKRVRIRKAGSQTLKFPMTRAFETPGWISADIGVMTKFSPHSRTDLPSRIASSIGEGLQWIVTADLNSVTDLSPTVSQLGVENKIRTSTGLRIGSTTQRSRGEYLIFPLELCGDNLQEQFADVLKSTTPSETINAVRSACPEAVLMAHRPIFPGIGMLTVQGYDFRTGQFPDIELETGVDAFQVWEGKRQLVVEQGMTAYYTTLAKNGGMITPVANSLSAGTYNEEPGYPRLYIPSDTEDPRELDIESLAQSIKDGRVQVTNGPFIDFKINGQEGGSLVTATDGTVEVSLKVYTPNWASVADISLNENGSFSRRFIFPAGSVDPEAGQVYPREGDEQVFNVKVSDDAVMNVIVRGDPSLNQDPVNPLDMPTGDPSVPTGQMSLAISAPIFIDVDGNGILDVDPEDFAPIQVRPDEDLQGVPTF